MGCVKPKQVSPKQGFDVNLLQHLTEVFLVPESMSNTQTEGTFSEMMSKPPMPAV